MSRDVMFGSRSFRVYSLKLRLGAATLGPWLYKYIEHVFLVKAPFHTQLRVHKWRL